jgi:hypothetical protein
MSIQSLISANSLVAAGIGIGDVVTIYTLGRRIGNWTSAESGDRDLLALLEEDETSILKRRGVIDIVRFKSRWGKTLRLLENGVPHTQKGHAVEKLLESSSRFTVMMTCIVAALDTFAADCTVRIVIKTFLQRLIPTPDFNEDAIVSQLGSRMNSWRSSAAVSTTILIIEPPMLTIPGERYEHLLSKDMGFATKKTINCQRQYA